MDSVLVLPTIGDIHRYFPPGSGFIPTGICQKLAVINPNLAVGWSGAMIAARGVIQELRKEAQNRVLWSTSDLESFFGGLDSFYKENTSFVGWSYDGKRYKNFCWGSGCLEHQLPQYGKVHIAGSGQNALSQKMKAMSIRSVQGCMNSLETAVMSSLGITTVMTGIECASGENLIEYYGGGYEIVSRVRDQFTKIGEVTYLIWVGHEEEVGEWGLAIPSSAIKYAYVGDMLIIRRATFAKRSDGFRSFEEERNYLVAPVDMPRDELAGIRMNRDAVPSFNSRFVCNFILLTDRHGQVGVLNRISYSGNNDGPVRFAEDKGRLTVSIHADFVKSIFQTVETCRSSGGPVP